MKTIKKKSDFMLEIEKKHDTPIEELLRTKYVDENKSIGQIKQELNISHITLAKWLEKAGIYSRKLKL